MNNKTECKNPHSDILFTCTCDCQKGKYEQCRKFHQKPGSPVGYADSPVNGIVTAIRCPDEPEEDKYNHRQANPDDQNFVEEVNIHIRFQNL
jgi:hypothetical protein